MSRHWEAKELTFKGWLRVRSKH